MSDLARKPYPNRIERFSVDCDSTRPGHVEHGIDCLRRAGDSEFPPLDGSEGANRAGAPVEPFEAAYDLMFEMVEMLVSRTGHLNQELVGFDFDNETPLPARAVKVGQSDALHRLMQEMLARWPVVAHIFQGWSLPDGGSPVNQHARSEVVVIALHTRERTCVARCRIDRSVTRAVSVEERRGASSVRLEKGKLLAMATPPPKASSARD